MVILLSIYTIVFKNQVPIKQINDIGFVKIPVPDVGSTNVGEEEWEDFEYTVEGEEFQAFQIKIVMKSKNQAKVPLIKDLRAIAFAS